MQLSEKTNSEANIVDSEIGAELAQLRRDLAEISRSVADLAAIQTPSAGRTMRDRIAETAQRLREETHVGDARIRDYVSQRFDATLASLEDRNAAVLRGLLTGATVLVLVGLMAAMLRRAR
jgi:hypothetical protein